MLSSPYHRRLGIGIASLTLALVGSSATAVAAAGPVATVTGDPAKRVDLHTVSNVKAPPRPAGAFTNRPTVPLAEYLAAKRGHTGGRRPATQAPRAPYATNLTGFNGITQATAQDGSPPDINGAVSSSFVTEIVNQHLTSFNKSTLAQTSDRSLATITGYTTKAIFDPRLLFDRTWQRWVASAEAFPESSTTQFVFLMISRTSDPGGSYFIYKLNFGPTLCGSGHFLDYPQIGMNQDAVVFTANCFNGNTSLGARTFAVAKAQLYNGLGFSIPVFSVATADGTTTPAIVLDNNPNMELITRNGPRDVTFKNPANGFYASFGPDVALTGLVTPSVPRAAGQKGCTTTSCRLDTSDGRFVAPSTQFGTQLWNAATYGFSGAGTFATVNWAQFNTATHATTQKGTAIADSCSDDFNASLVAQTNGSMWVNWTSTDPNGSSCGGTFARQFIGTRVSGNAAGSLPSRINPFTSSFELTGDFDSNFGLQRWGDTSSTSLDPSAANVAWTWNESVASSANWGTRAQKVSNP